MNTPEPVETDQQLASYIAMVIRNATLATDKAIVLLDYETNEGVDDTSRPLEPDDYN